MAQSFSNPEPSNGATFANNNKPTLLRMQITDHTVVDTTASRFNVNGIWYSEPPYAIDLWSSPSRAGKLLSGLNPGGLGYPVLQDNTGYTWYFEITETGGGGTFTSPTYTFTIGTPVPSKAINPTPTNTASDVTLDQQTTTWENGGGATSYNIYYGIQSGNLTLVSSGQVETFTIYQITNGSPFNYAVTRYWRIDSVNASGTTTGDEWSFTTIVFDYPPGGVRGVGGGYGGDDGSGEAEGYGGGTFCDAQLHTKTRLIGFARNTLYYENL